MKGQSFAIFRNLRQNSPVSYAFGEIEIAMSRIDYVVLSSPDTLCLLPLFASLARSTALDVTVLHLHDLAWSSSFL